MIFSILYMMVEFFGHGTLSPAVIMLFLVVDVASIEALSAWIGTDTVEEDQN